MPRGLLEGIHVDAVLPFIFALLAAVPQVPLGWLPIPELPGASRANRRGWAIIWTAVLAGVKYEQPNLVEAPGAIVVVRDARGRVGFVKQHRIHRPRLAEALTGEGGLGYVALLATRNLWGKLFESHPGTISLELPAGLVDPKDIALGLDYEALVRRIAEREAREEAGFRIRVGEVFLDAVNANPVFLMHGQSVVCAVLESIGDASPDPEEAIKGRVWLTPDEIKDAIRAGRIFDARIVHALYLAKVI